MRKETESDVTCPTEMFAPYLSTAAVSSATPRHGLAIPAKHWEAVMRMLAHPAAGTHRRQLKGRRRDTKVATLSTWHFTGGVLVYSFIAKVCNPNITIQNKKIKVSQCR